MQAVRNKDTGPEMIVRRLLFRLGYRYRIHCKGLPGTPDIAFPTRRKAVFIHGCYWHGHGCKKGQLPKTDTSFWSNKIRANRDRDARKEAELEDLGWKVLTIWQCDLSDLDRVETRLKAFLGHAQFRSTSTT
jgi:DNA mismatch endonuclease (patch repair protein)